MSKLLNAILPALLPLLLILQSFNNSFGQNLSAKITIDSTNSSSLSVSGSFEGTANRNFWLLKDFGGFGDLGKRISDVSLKSSDGRSIDVRQLQPGEYLASAGFEYFEYRIDLLPPKTPSVTAHVSWISNDRGIIMLGDVLP